VSLRLRIVPDPPPDAVRRWALRALFRATVDAFGSPMPCVRGRSSDRLLDAYTSRSDELARAVLEDTDQRRYVEARLSANTGRLGRRIRRALGIRSTDDALEAARRLYALIGIDLRARDPHRVVVSRCAFASRYSPEVCGVMAAADAGLFEGLTGGARLTFLERITTGAPACVATLEGPHR